MKHSTSVRLVTEIRSIRYVLSSPAMCICIAFISSHVCVYSFGIFYVFGPYPWFASVFKDTSLKHCSCLQLLTIRIWIQRYISFKYNTEQVIIIFIWRDGDYRIEYEKSVTKKVTFFRLRRSIYTHAFAL